MENLSFIVGVIGNIISVCLFLSPITTFIRIVRNRDAEEFNSLPYISTLLSTSLWTYYGITKPGVLLVATVNGFGAVVELVYVILFLIFARPPIRVYVNGFGAVVELVYVILFLIFACPPIRVTTAKLAALLDVGLLGFVILSSTFMEDDMKINIIGIVGAAVNIIMYASPLAVLRSVVERRNVEHMPLLLSLCSLLNGGVWTLYAVLVKDIFLLVPNGIGFILATIQLMVYAHYRNEENRLRPYDETLI